MTIAGLLMLSFAERITGLRTADPDVLYWGTRCLQILALGLPMYAVGMVMIQSLNGAADTESPAALNFICFWLVQIPLAYWFATSTSLEANGAFVATVSESLLTILSVLVFQCGNWKRHVA